MSDNSFSPSIHTRIESEREAALPEASLIKEFRKYSRGRQRTTLTPGQTKVLRGLLGNIFCDNVCKRVLQEIRNRLRLSRFDVYAGEQMKAALNTFIDDVWILNRMPSMAASVHWATLRDGNTAVSLNWVDGRVILVREKWWNGDTGMFVSYDENDRPVYAVNEWVTNEGRRRTVYFPDQILRFAARGNGWEQIQLATDATLGVEWLDRTGAPLGIPVVHFANVQVPNDGDASDFKIEPDSRYGSSELDGGLLGLQDEVNDLHRDVTAAARFAAYQMAWATGIKATTTDGTPVKYDVMPGAFLTEANENARFGTLPAGSLAELERALTIKLQAIGRMAAVPMYLIAGDWPSGEALMRAEMPLIDKVETIGEATGPAWSSLMHKAVRLSNTFGGTQLDEDALITAEFMPAARRDPMTLAELADRLSKHVGPRETLRILGYSPEQQEAILLDVAEARATAIAEAPMEAS